MSVQAHLLAQVTHRCQGCRADPLVPFLQWVLVFLGIRQILASPWDLMDLVALAVRLVQALLSGQ